jgi:hypothetical protein
MLRVGPTESPKSDLPGIAVGPGTIVAKAGKSCADSFIIPTEEGDAIEIYENNTPERNGTIKSKFRATTGMRSLNRE